jgi:hypothetical protein
MRTDCNISEIQRFLIWILYTGLLWTVPAIAQADCVQNQNEVPACLSGTAVAGDYAGAIIQENGEPGLHQVMAGDIVAGWKVEEIGAGYVVLKRGARTARLELPQGSPTNVEEVQPDASTLRPDIRQRPVRHSVISPTAAGE